MPKDNPGQIAKLQLNNMGYSGQDSGQDRLVVKNSDNKANLAQLKLLTRAHCLIIGSWDGNLNLIEIWMV
jgi:hypothetical protein